MDKLLAMALLGSGMAKTFGPAMNPADIILKKNNICEVLNVPKGSPNGETTAEMKKKSGHVVLAPMFDGIYCFETMVLTKFVE
jgi:hypothetical protein